MTATASGIGVKLAYTLETSDQTLSGTNARGAEPGSPSMRDWPSTSKNLNASRAVVRPNEISNRGMRILGSHGLEQVGGDLGFDLAKADFNDQLGWLFMSDWTANSADTTATAIDAAVSGSRFTGTGLFTGFAVGDTVVASGFSAAVDGVYLVVSKPDNDTLGVQPAIPADVTGGGDERILKPGATLTRKAAPTLYGMTVERWFSDAATPFGTVYNGVVPVSGAFNWNPGGASTCQVNALGIKGRTTTARLDASPTAVAGNPKFLTLHGGVVLDGAEQAFITGFSFTLNQQNTLGEAVIGSRYAPDTFAGESFVEGSVSFYLPDRSYLELFHAETVFPLWAMTRPAPDSTDFHAVYLPAAKIMAAPVNPGQTGPVLMTGSLEAGDSAGFGSSIAYQVSDTPS